MSWMLSNVEGLADKWPRDLEVAAAVYHKLDSEYPGHNWMVNADHAQGIVTVKLLYLDVAGKHGKYGFLIKLDRVKSDPGLRCVVTAGGEMLERFGLMRARATDESKLRALDHGLDLAR